MKLRINAKCSDMFRARLTDNGGAWKDYDGYVPDWLPNIGEEHHGDYVSLEIDIETGQIINWRKPTLAQLKKTFV